MWRILLAYLCMHTVIVSAGKKEECPTDSEDDHLFRLGRSRFYIFQKPKGMQVTWEEGDALCKKHGLVLGKIDDLPTSVHVGKVLETFLRPLGWPENFYWMNAKFDLDAGTYVWQDSKKPIKFANFFYKRPRPKGFGGIFWEEDLAPVNQRVQNCLMLSLPLSLKEDYNPDAIGPYGMHTSWWERSCVLKFKANVLCESENPNCEQEQDKSLFTKPNTTYYNDFWPMANRKFVVYWKPHNRKSARQLCEANKMKLYEPRAGDQCLLAYLKNHMREVNSYSFWTDVKFDLEKGFLYSDGEPVPEIAQNFTYDYSNLLLSSESKRRKRSSITASTKKPEPKRNATFPFDEICASMTWNNEVDPWNKDFCDCPFNSMALSPENCNDPIGVICQQQDLIDQECDEKYIAAPADPGKYKRDDKVPPKFAEFHEFEGLHGKKFMRSAYKQTGKSGICPEGYQKLTDESDQYHLGAKEFQSASHPYDHYSPYWLDASHKGKCHLIQAEYLNNKVKAVTHEWDLNSTDCSEFKGFVICEEKE